MNPEDAMCIPAFKPFVQSEGFPYSSKPAAAATAKSLQSCPTLCDPRDGSPPASPVPGFSKQERWSGLPFPSPVHESKE